jgi:hypothetical protein
MSATYPLKIQASCSKGQKPRLYLSFPLPLTETLGLNPGDEVQWDLIARNQLRLLRLEPSPTKAKRSPTTNPAAILTTGYPLKIQAICSKGQKPRLYVSFPMPLAAAIGLNPHEAVQWELRDKNDLQLLRLEPS